MPAAAGCEAKHALSGDIAPKPSTIVDEGPWIGELALAGGFGMCQAPPDPFIPGVAIMLGRRFQLRQIESPDASCKARMTQL